MAGTFLRLKLALLRGRFKGGWQIKIGMVLSLVLGLPLGILAAIGIAVAGRVTDAGPELAVLVCYALTFGWSVGPPLLFGVDDTLDPARLAPLPLSGREMATGMVAASVVGVGPAVTILMLLGLLIGVAPFGPGAVVVVAALAGQFVLCIVVSRLVTTALSDVLRSRRGKDAAGFLLVLSLVTITQIPNLLVNVVDIDEAAVAEGLRSIADIVALTPFGWFGNAVGHGADGRLGTAVGFLAAGLVLVVVCGYSWLVSLERLVTRSPDTGAGPASGDGRLFHGITRIFPRTRLGATAARTIRAYQRDTRWRVAYVVSVGFGIVALIAGVNVLDADPRSVLAVAVPATLFAFNAVNAFGVDGPAAAQLVLAGGDHREDIRGMHLGMAVLAVPVLVVEVVVLVVVTGGAGYAVAALVGAFGMLGLGYGIGSIASVQVPGPQPEVGLNSFSGATGQNMTNGLLQGLTILILMAAVLPFAVVALLVSSPVVLTLVAMALLAIGMIGWWWTTGWSARRLAARAPEFLADLDPV